MRTTTRRTAIAAVTIGLALAACGTDGADTAGDTAATEPADVQTSEPDAVDQATGETSEDAGPAEQTSEVDIDDFRFKPASIEVAAGTTVTWINRDATAHTVTSGSKDDPKPDEYDIRVEEKDEEITFTYDEPGTYDYYCVLHPFMEGTVTVTG